MTTRGDLYDEIIRVAADLFMKQSYAATSIKQIAKAAGCTTAALYYYFEEGKEGILRQVIDNLMPNLTGLLESLQDAKSLYELVMRIGITMWEAGEDILQRTRWLMVEFPNMQKVEHEKLHGILLHFHHRLADLILPFVANQERADVLAWIIYTSIFGYGQLFVTLNLQSTIEAPNEAFIFTLADMIRHLEKGS